MTDMYQAAREYAAEAEAEAKKHVGEMSLEELRTEYVALTAMAAYYTKMEVVMAQPRFHTEAIKELLIDMKAQEILHQAEIAQEQGVKISGTARVPTQPLLALLARLQQLVNPESDQ